MDSSHLFEERKEVPKDKLDLLSELCLKYRNISKTIEDTEEYLKEKIKELEKISRELIPNLLNELHLSEIRLSTGEKIIVEEKLKASIPKKNLLVAYRNMVLEEGDENKISSLFTEKIIIDESKDEILDLLLDKEIPYTVDRNIHWQTLNKYCREKISSGGNIPEGISVFQYQETIIK